MRKGLVYIIIFVLLLAAPSGIRYWRFYQLRSPDRQDPVAYDPTKIIPVPTPEAATFVDEPQVGSGLVLLDQAHRNNFTLDEIGYLDSRLAARGFELLPFHGGDLSTALRPVSALVVIAPLDLFSLEEIQAVSDFVRRGGRLLLIGDPTRFNLLFDEEDALSLEFTLETDEIPLNSLANEFDISFTGDYLYNTVENEGNFRNIILRPDSSSDLLAGVERLVFYGSHSLQVGPDAELLLSADANTWSSATDRAGNLTLAATSYEGKVLALGDVHFLTEPYFTVYDNSRFIAQLADFLVASTEREFVLADFPYFYEQTIDLVYTGRPELGPDAFDEIIGLQEALRRVDLSISLAATARPEHDVLYLGLFNQADDVAEILAQHGISLTIDPPILTDAEQPATADEMDEVPESDEAGEEDKELADAIRLIQSDLGDVQMEGTALILLDENQGKRRVVVLAASGEGLENSVKRLLDLIPIEAEYVLADCLLQDNLALCPTNVAGEAVEAELETSGMPEPEEEEEVVIEEEGEAEEDSEAEEEEGAAAPDAVDQGSIELGDTVEGDLDEDEAHSWSFSGGPETVDIVVSSDEIDAVLELYGPDNTLIDTSDSGFSGDNEELLGVEIPDDGTYLIVVRDFFGDSGGYALSIDVAAGANDQGSGRILIFGDNDGQPLGSGFTSVETIAGLLEEEYQVTIWVSTEDGVLNDVSPVDYDLVVWDSGDYRDEAGFFDEDSETLLAYAEEGGDLLITGASPTLLGGAETELLLDLEIVGEDPVLLRGLNSGDVLALDQAYETVVGGPSNAFGEEEGTVFLLRGPESAESEMIVGVATVDEQKTVVLLVPLAALPDNVQSILLGNLMAWFGLSSS